MPERTQRRLAAILAADVVGYSRMVRADEEGTIVALKALRSELIEPTLVEHNGRIVKLMGDGILAEFASVVDAVRAAVEMQEAVANRNAGLPPDQRIQFRVGINLGDVVIDGDDIHGDGVNVAARLEGLADPGGICISGAVHDQVKNRMKLAIEDLGERQIKNIDEPVRVLRWRGRARAELEPLVAERVIQPPSEKPSIVVLPFANMSGNSEEEYFADGVTEDIITDLSRFQEVLVIARNSSFAYKSKASDVRTVAHELRVNYVVEGSIRRAGERLRATVQLIDAETAAHLWAERYDRLANDIFELQDEIVESIVHTLVKRLRVASENRAARKAPRSLAAYDYVLKAKALIFDDRERLLGARSFYESAIALDQNCGRAYCGLALTHLFEWTSGWTDTPELTLERALDNARKAASLDDLDAEAQRRLGIIHLYRREREDAEFHLKRALALNPNDADAMANWALFLIYEGRPLDAIGELERATRRNPFHPSHYFWYLGLAHYGAKRYETALVPLRKAIAAFPNFVAPHRHLAACYAQLGQRDAAREECAKILEIEPSFSVTKLAQTLAYRDPADLEHYCQGLRNAGLPD